MELILIKLKKTRFYRFFRDLKELSLYEQKVLYFAMLVLIFVVAICAIMTIDLHNEVYKIKKKIEVEK